MTHSSSFDPVCELSELLALALAVVAVVASESRGGGGGIRDVGKEALRFRRRRCLSFLDDV
jgi:hypothetical protein